MDNYNKSPVNNFTNPIESLKEKLKFVVANVETDQRPLINEKIEKPKLSIDEQLLLIDAQQTELREKKAAIHKSVNMVVTKIPIFGQVWLLAYKIGTALQEPMNKLNKALGLGGGREDTIREYTDNSMKVLSIKNPFNVSDLRSVENYFNSVGLWVEHMQQHAPEVLHLPTVQKHLALKKAKINLYLAAQDQKIKNLQKQKETLQQQQNTKPLFTSTNGTEQTAGFNFSSNWLYLILGIVLVTTVIKNK